MKELFDYCVDIIKYIAQITGLTYEEVNIYLFVIIHPLITLILLILCIKYYRKVKREMIKGK
jgi:hypothetical protein